MGVLIVIDNIKLSNGKIISKIDEDYFPAMQDFDKECRDPCDVCPVVLICQRNNSFGCMVSGMFSGCYFDFETILDFCNKEGLRL